MDLIMSCLLEQLPRSAQMLLLFCVPFPLISASIPGHTHRRAISAITITRQGLSIPDLLVCCSAVQGPLQCCAGHRHSTNSARTPLSTVQPVRITGSQNHLGWKLWQLMTVRDHQVQPPTWPTKSHHQIMSLGDTHHENVFGVQVFRCIFSNRTVILKVNWHKCII